MPHETRIPRPPAKPGPLQVLSDSVSAQQAPRCTVHDLDSTKFSCSQRELSPVKRMQDMNRGKKRGAATPLTGKPTKRAAQGDAGLDWEAVAAAAGWASTESALQHPLRLKKNERDPQAVKKVCLEYIRQLRALGWFLNHGLARLEGECAALHVLQVEAEAACAAEKRTAETLRADLAQQEERLRLHTAEASKQKAAAEALERQLEAALARALMLQGQLDSEISGHGDTQASLQRAREQATSAAGLHAQSQHYCAQLQEYNANLQRDMQSSALQLQTFALQLQRLQEEKAENAETVAALRGTLHMRTAELTAAHGEAAAAAHARQAAADELRALRAELEKARTAANGIDALSKDLVLSRVREHEMTALRGRAETAEAGLAEALTRFAEAERVRREMHNEIMDLKGAIRVFVRVRPAADEAQSAVRIGAGGSLELQTAQGRNSSVTTFSYDRVFAPSAPQAEVFEEVSQLVQSALDGYRVCIFAYGATGSGKTHTMIGGADDGRGVIPRALEKLYARANELQQHHGWTINVKATCLEVFCEDVVDLLGDGPPPGKKHTITHGACGAEVAHLKSVALDLALPEKAGETLAAAMQRRSVAATACNERSSRSHLVFTVAVSASSARTGQKLLGLLNLVDLAGSERLSKSGATGDRLKETQAINKSLSSLGDVIAALGSKAEHVPYRNSKLTWLLQPCLSADAKALFFINISSDSQTQESLCSLRFGAKINATTIGVPRACHIDRPDSKQTLPS